VKGKAFVNEAATLASKGTATAEASQVQKWWKRCHWGPLRARSVRLQEERASGGGCEYTLNGCLAGEGGL
jgi:hypothetical protein